MALLAGSPALDAGNDGLLNPPYELATDQRGFPRKVGSHVDIGAFELRPPNISCELACPAVINTCNESGQCGAVVYFDTPMVTNCDDFVIACLPPSGSFFSVGTNSVLCTAVAAAVSITNTCIFQVVVRDCEPPVIQSITATPDVLWPPNHKMQPVTLNVSATDNCHLATCKIISVTSNERSPDRDRHDDSLDWQITGDLTLNLRAETSGPRTERIYTITVQCADDSGNTSTAVTQVIVCHSGPRREQYGGGRH